MKVRIISHSLVRQLLPVGECIDVMTEALRAAALGKYGMPLRTVVWLPDKRGALGMMPSYSTEKNIMGSKMVTVFPGNAGTEFDSHQGTVLLFEAQHGCPLAILDASSITAIRTPAVSALATRLLAREDAKDLALLGAGIQAYGHLEALLAVRPISRVRVWSKPLEDAHTFAEIASKQFKIPVQAMATSQETTSGADIICTVTSSRDPILFSEAVKAGAHINAVGACTPIARELDTPTVVKSRLFVDKRESTMSEAGDFLIPKKEGAISDTHIIGELGDILLGKLVGRQSQEQVTLFKSLGLALEDIASAHYIYNKAVEKNLGEMVELGDKRHSK